MLPLHTQPLYICILKDAAGQLCTVEAEATLEAAAALISEHTDAHRDGYELVAVRLIEDETHCWDESETVAEAWLRAVKDPDDLDDVPRFIRHHAADLLDEMKAESEESYANERAYERGVAFEYNHGRL